MSPWKVTPHTKDVTVKQGNRWLGKLLGDAPELGRFEIGFCLVTQHCSVNQRDPSGIVNHFLSCDSAHTFPLEGTHRPIGDEVRKLLDRSTPDSPILCFSAIPIFQIDCGLQAGRQQ